MVGKVRGSKAEAKVFPLRYVELLVMSLCLTDNVCLIQPRQCTGGIPPGDLEGSFYLSMD